MFYPLRTQRLAIRPLEHADLDVFVSYRQDPEIARYQSWEPTYSKQDAIELIKSQADVLIPMQGQWLQLGIHKLGNDQIVGDLALHSLAGSDGLFEIGFTIAKSHQGQGFAKEATSSLMSFLFADQGAKKFVANSDRRNKSSISVLLALGFERNASRGWTEIFKNEEIAVDYFETN